MIRLRINELLEQQEKTRYWLVEEMRSSYKTINKLADNVVTSIRFETLEKLMVIFDLTDISQLIEYKKGQ